MKLRFLLPAVVLAAVFAAPMHIPAQTTTPESNSTTSGDRSEPTAVTSPEKKEAAGGTEAFRNSPSVQKLGHVFGLSPSHASSTFEWLNFLVLAAAVLYGLAKALPKTFRSRSQQIQKNIVEARVATDEARGRLSSVEARLSKLDAEIAALRADNERAAAEEERRIAAQAEEEKARILQSAEQEIAAVTSAAERGLREFAAKLAVERAAAQMQISPEDDRTLIHNFAARAGANGDRN